MNYESEFVPDLSGSQGQKTAAADPFDSASDAIPSECEVRQRFVKVEQPTVGLVGKPKRKKTDLSPMQRRWFEQHGYTFARVEHANAWGAVSVDLWGFGDWLAVKEGEGILLVQTCRHSDASTRLRKARSRPELEAWLRAGGRFAVHGWEQAGGPGSRWELKAREITLEAI